MSGVGPEELALWVEAVENFLLTDEVVFTEVIHKEIRIKP